MKYDKIIKITKQIKSLELSEMQHQILNGVLRMVLAKILSDMDNMLHSIDFNLNK